MKVGDTVYIRPTFGETYPIGEPQPAKVVYMHPAGRYFTVRFVLPRGRRYYESYPGAATPKERTQKNEKNRGSKPKGRRR